MVEQFVLRLGVTFEHDMFHGDAHGVHHGVDHGGGEGAQLSGRDVPTGEVGSVGQRGNHLSDAF